MAVAVARSRRGLKRIVVGRPSEATRGRGARRFVLGLLVVGVPLLIALAGPLFAGDAGPRGTSLTTGSRPSARHRLHRP